MKRNRDPTFKYLVVYIYLTKFYGTHAYFYILNDKKNCFHNSTYVILLCVFQIFSARDMTDVLNKAKDILSDEKKDWEKRNEAVSSVLILILSFVHEKYQNLLSLI